MDKCSHELISYKYKDMTKSNSFCESEDSLTKDESPTLYYAAQILKTSLKNEC